ncbi:hypothetical protein LPJ56_006880 [Coemansia sp. RSA 2599]|nr:hypothetical protein LPJ56_006880 [Coemansia sp. RSA 2599]
MWKEKYAQSENRLAATYGEKRPNASSEDSVHQSDSLVLENELAELKEKGGAVKQRLEDCDMLLQTLVDYNKEQHEADCLQINGLISDVEDLSSVKTAMMDYARTAMMRSHKLEDLCRALQAQRKESVQSNSQRKHQQQLQQHMHKHGIKGLNSQLFATMESVFASSVAMDDTSGLTGDQMSLDDAMGDLQPLMSQMAMAFSTGNAPKQQVMVGESPRIIRTPRRRSSNLKKPNLKPGKQSQLSPTNSLPNKDMSITLNADATKSPTIKPTSGFVGAPSAEFTFSTP